MVPASIVVGSLGLVLGIATLAGRAQPSLTGAGIVVTVLSAFVLVLAYLYGKDLPE